MFILPTILLSLLTTPPPTTAQKTWWKPTTGTTWNIDLSTQPKTFSPSNTTLIYDLDLFATTNTTISSLKASGHKIICYYSAGSWENWRPDASEFPKSALGKPLAGWPGERWVNTSDPTVRKIMAARIQLASDKGCDGVDPDNIDGYENKNGLHLTEDTAVDYVTYLSETAHALGLASGLKNGNDIVSRVINVTDWEVNEQCAKYNECDTLLPFIKAGKPVFHIEYNAKKIPPKKFVKKSCKYADAKGFSTVLKHLSLDEYTATCPHGHVVPF